jgi:HEAT repeat protein
VGGLSRRSKLLLGAGLVLALLGTAWWAAGRSRSGELAHRFVPGRRLVYQLDYTSAASSDFSRLFPGEEAGQKAPSGLAHSSHVILKGEMEITTLGQERGRVRLAYRVRGAKAQITVNGSLDRERSQAVEAELARPLLVEVDGRGRVLSVRLGAEGVMSALTRALVSATQVVLPSSPRGQSAWEAEEDSPVGTAVVRYQASPGEERGTFDLRKSNARYLSPAKPRKNLNEAHAEMTYRPSGQLEARMDGRRGRLLSLSGAETTTAFVGKQEVGNAETTIHLALLSEEKVAGQELAGLAAEGAARYPVALALFVPESEEAREAGLQRSELGKATAESLLADLGRAERAPQGTVNETPLYLKFKALAYLQPEVADRLGQRLAGAPADSVTFRVLTQALAGCGRPQALNALVEVVRRRHHEWPAMMEMVPALGLARAPTPEAEAVLHELAARAGKEVRSMAQLALGLMAHNLADSDPARAAVIVRWALAQLEAARDAGGRRQMLLVLGNTGSLLAWPALRAHLSAAEPEVRAAAVAGLRWVEAREAEAALCRALTEDGDANVRVEAAQALEARAASAATVAAQARALRRDGSVAVRLAVLKGLAQGRAEAPEAEKALREAARDSVKEVRESAEALLAEAAE